MDCSFMLVPIVELERRQLETPKLAQCLGGAQVCRLTTHGNLHTSIGPTLEMLGRADDDLSPPGHGCNPVLKGGSIVVEIENTIDHWAQPPAADPAVDEGDPGAAPIRKLWIRKTGDDFVD